MSKHSENAAVHVYGNDMLFWRHGDAKYCLLVRNEEYPMDPRADFDNLATMFCQHSRHTLGDQNTGYSSLGEFWAELVKNNVPKDVLLKRLKDGTVKGYMEHVENDFDEDERPSDGDLLEDFYDLLYDGESFSMGAQAVKDYVAWLPLWLYDHSGITMSCGDRVYPYNDQWDSGLVGFIAIPKDKALKELTVVETGPDGQPVMTDDSQGRQVVKRVPVTEANWEQAAIEHMKAEVQTYDQYLTGDVYYYTVYVSGREDNEEGATKNGNPMSSENDWDELDSCGGFFGSDVMTNGIVESVGNGLEEAIRSGDYDTGKAEPYTVTRYNFVRHAGKKS